MDLRNADLHGANAARAIFTNAHLFEADLSGANMIRARFEFADLTGAECQSADLKCQSADLRGAIQRDFGKARVSRSGTKTSVPLGAIVVEIFDCRPPAVEGF
jgi:uncharacterized protein YjbI with pentapeptide repeats